MFDLKDSSENRKNFFSSEFDLGRASNTLEYLIKSFLMYLIHANLN